GQRGHVGELRVGKLAPHDRGRAAVSAPRADHALGRDDDVERNVVGRHRNRLVDDLELVDGRDDRRIVVDQLERAGQRELEIAVASAFSDPGALLVDGDAAGYDEVDASDLRG